MSLLCCRAHSTVACRGGDSRDPTAAGRRENRVPHFMAVAVGKGVFRTPSTWTSSARLAATFFEPSMANSCWSSRAPVL